MITNLTINNSKFEQCFGFKGGAFYISTIQSSYITINNSIFIDVFSLYTGGIFFLDISAELMFIINKTNFNEVGSISEGGIFFFSRKRNSYLFF